MKTFRALLVFLFFVPGILIVSAEEPIDPMKLPKLTQYVEDFSNVLPLTELESLRLIARDYETKTTHQMVVVLFPHREGNELFDIGMRIFQENSIGQAGKDNGILLLIATEERKIRIITGYGLEGDVPDVLASDMIERDIRPLVNDEKYTEAIRVFFTRVERAVGTQEGKQMKVKAKSQEVFIASVLAILFGLMFSFNIFFLGFALFFFVVASFSLGSVYPILLFLLGSLVIAYLGLRYFREAFLANFFRVPRNTGEPG